MISFSYHYSLNQCFACSVEPLCPLSTPIFLQHGHEQLPAIESWVKREEASPLDQETMRMHCSLTGYPGCSWKGKLHLCNQEQSCYRIIDQDDIPASTPASEITFKMLLATTISLVLKQFRPTYPFSLKMLPEPLNYPSTLWSGDGFQHKTPPILFL